jgi:hypothetical protein
MILRLAASLRVQGERRQRQTLHRRHHEMRQIVGRQLVL